MKLPERIDTPSQLEEILSDPTDRDLECVSRLTGDVLILGAGGKMGPSLTRRVHRALTRIGHGGRVVAASRFSSAVIRASLDAEGIQTVSCDLLDPAQIAALPRCPNVLFLAGRKFGTLDRTDITWATNTVIPARVAEHFFQSRMVVFSTGNVYPMVPTVGPASTEQDPPAPTGEYAQSCLGRERVVEFVSRERGMATVIFRLNYAVDLRYGTLVDIAQRVLAGEEDRPDGRLLQRDLAGRREQLCAAQPRACLVAAGDPQCHRRGADQRSRDGRVVRRGFPPPATIREQRRPNRAPERFEPVPRPAGRARRCRSPFFGNGSRTGCRSVATP